MKAEIEKIDKQIAREARDRTAAAWRRWRTYQKRIEAAPTRGSELTELTRDYETLQATYTRPAREERRLERCREPRAPADRRTVQDSGPGAAARAADQPESPAAAIDGLMAGLGFGLALMGLIEYLDKTLKSEADVTAALNLLVLATVPILPEVGGRAGAPAEAGRGVCDDLAHSWPPPAPPRSPGECGNSMSRLREAFEKAAGSQGGGSVRTRVAAAPGRSCRSFPPTGTST